MNEEKDSKIGIAVSVYDKFDDLAVLHDILRENFDDDYFISVHCNHPDAEKELIKKRGLDIDHLSTGEKIKSRNATQRYIRILNSIKESCKGAIDDCDYLMHLHADAWPLNEDKIRQILEKLEDESYEVAARGRGTTWQRVGDYRLGMIMDQFIFFDTDALKRKSFFDFKLTDLMPHWGIHDSLMLLLLGRIGRSNIYFYSDMTSDLYWDGKKAKPRTAVVKPSVYDPDWELLHCGREEFPDDYGKSVQTMYLKRHGLLEGKNIQELVSKHEKESKTLIKELRRKEIKQNLEVMTLFFDPRRFGRCFGIKQKFLDSPLKSKLKYVIENILSGSYNKANKALFRFLPYENPARRSDDRSLSAEWPRKDFEIYDKKIDREDLNGEIGSEWFRKRLMSKDN